MNYFLFINKKSGQGNNSQKFTYLKTQLDNADKLSIYETSSSKEMIQYIKKHLSKIDVLIFAGGDGTIREALRYCYLNKIDLPIGLLPAGTGNDFIRSLNIPNNIEKAVDIILKGNTSNIHAVKLNKDYFFNIASVGLDAEIVKQHQRLKKYIRGASSYYVSALYKMVTFRPKDTTLIIDNKKVINKYMLIAVANGQYYGGGMNIAPDADVTNDYLSIYCAKKMPRYKIPYYFAKMQSGDHMGLANIDVYKCKNLTIKSDKEIVINLDGDLIIGNYADIQIKNDYLLKIFSGLNGD